MIWYQDLLSAITTLLGMRQTLEVKTLLSVLVEPTYGPEQELAVSMVKEMEERSIA